MRVITDHGTDQTFGDFRTCVRLTAKFWDSAIFQKSPFRFIRALAWGSKLWFVSLWSSDAGPIVTYGFEHGFIFAALQWFFSPFVSPRTHFMFDLLLCAPRTGVAGIADRLKIGLFNRAVDGAVVWGMTDVEAFVSAHGIDRDKLIFHHYHTTLRDFTYNIHDGGYVFAGGNSGRDYQTTIEALRDCPLPVIIATTLSSVAQSASQYPNITVRGVTDLEFRQLLAGCTIFVECHEANFFRTAGHQTFLNAMYCGKAVVLADEKSAKGYIEHELDGLVVQSGDAAAVREAVNRLISDSTFCDSLANAAREKVSSPSFTIPNTLQSIYNLAISRTCEKAGLKPDSAILRLF